MVTVNLQCFLPQHSENALWIGLTIHNSGQYGTMVPRYRCEVGCSCTASNETSSKKGKTNPNSDLCFLWIHPARVLTSLNYFHRGKFFEWPKTTRSTSTQMWKLAIDPLSIFFRGIPDYLLWNVAKMLGNDIRYVLTSGTSETPNRRSTYRLQGAPE